MNQDCRSYKWKFFDEVFDEFFDEFWQYFLAIFFDKIFRRIFLMNFFDNFFRFAPNLLTIASFRIGVLSILLFRKFDHPIQNFV